ncbi:MAG: YicC family protein [Alphaproteobacteria bacterium]|nr:YicC family protein [Alphaproteobacteria bacterium]
MTVASMTGFARAEGGDGDLRWSWEVRSVNGRNLDIRVRFPAGFEALDGPARALVAERCRRGSVNLMLAINRERSRALPRLNRAAVDAVVAILADLRDRFGAEAPRLDGLLQVPGLIELDQPDEGAEARDRRERVMLESLKAALVQLATMRLEEGERLRHVMGDQLAAITSLAQAAAASEAAQPRVFRERLRAQLALLLEEAPGLPEERLAQEAALLASRADVREEIDRLSAHVAAVDQTIAGGGAVGRRLDFLCQEMNREANTLCSKAADVALTRIGVDLKVMIEQLREQVQNLE